MASFGLAPCMLLCFECAKVIVLVAVHMEAVGSALKLLICFEAISVMVYCAKKRFVN